MNLELTKEQKSYREKIERFAREVVAPRAASIDKTGEYPADVMHAASAHGLLGVTIPKAWGGTGLDYLSYALAMEAIARASATVAVALSVTNSLVAEVIAHAGRDQQRERWLRPLAAGEAIGAFALSEPDAGTDAANQKSTAVRAGIGLSYPRTQGLGGQRGGGERRDCFRVHTTGPARAGRDGVSRPDEHAGNHAYGSRRFARRARSRLHGSRVRHRGV